MLNDRFLYLTDNVCADNPGICLQNSKNLRLMNAYTSNLMFVSWIANWPWLYFWPEILGFWTVGKHSGRKQLNTPFEGALMKPIPKLELKIQNPKLETKKQSNAKMKCCLESYGSWNNNKHQIKKVPCQGSTCQRKIWTFNPDQKDQAILDAQCALRGQRWTIHLGTPSALPPTAPLVTVLRSRTRVGLDVEVEVTSQSQQPKTTSEPTQKNKDSQSLPRGGGVMNESWLRYCVLGAFNVCTVPTEWQWH